MNSKYYTAATRVTSLPALTANASITSKYLMRGEIGILHKYYEDGFMMPVVDTVVDITIHRYAALQEHFTEIEREDSIVDIELILRKGPSVNVGDSLVVRGRWGALTGIKGSRPTSIEALLLSEFSEVLRKFALEGYDEGKVIHNLLALESAFVTGGSRLG